MERIKANIYGASGHAKVILDIIFSKGGDVNKIFDDNPEIKKLAEHEVSHDTSGKEIGEHPIIIAIGDNRTRKIVSGRMVGEIQKAISHSTAVISPDVEIGAGSVVMPNSVINTGANIGKHCIINSGAVVEHDVRLKDFVHISPNASVAGNVSIGEGTQVGIGACVIPGIKIGKWVTIGAGAVIIENVPDFAVVVGNPGKIIKYNKF